MVKVSIFAHFGLDPGRTYFMDDKAEGCFRLAAYTGLEKVYLDEAFLGKSAGSKSLVTQVISELEDAERAEIPARKQG